MAALFIQGFFYFPKKANTKIVSLRLNYNTDKDIIQKLDEVNSKMGYIKELIRKDLQTNKK